MCVVCSELLVMGGDSAKSQIQMLSDGVDVVCGTPGRLDDLVSSGKLDLSGVSLRKPWGLMGRVGDEGYTSVDTEIDWVVLTELQNLSACAGVTVLSCVCLSVCLPVCLSASNIHARELQPLELSNFSLNGV